MKKAVKPRLPLLGADDRTHSSTDRPGISKDDPEKPMPEQIGQYKLISLLGRGGMGAVYLAQDTRLERQVALKMLPEATELDPEARELLTREAHALASLNHPGICTIHGIEQSQERLFLIFEYIDGTTFRDLLALPAPGWPPRPGIAASYILQVAEALQAAHTAGVIHRDIKSANLMLTPDHRVKVLDFGGAQLSRNRQIEGGDILVGTPSYLSPEQARGEPLDNRTDLWSLGVVFYEILAAKTPFAAESFDGLRDAILNDEPRPLRQLRPEIAAPLVRIIHKLLRKDREQRYQSARALIQDLRPLAVPLTEEVGIPTYHSQVNATSVRTEMNTLVGTAERRAITFLSLELVSGQERAGKADTSADIDDARELCLQIIEGHEGSLESWDGKRAAAYFGYPRAREDAPHLAVSAALALAELFARPRSQYSIKIGVETSFVVAMLSPTGAAGALSGEGFKMADQLSQSAGANEVLAGPRAQRLIEGRFELSAERQSEYPDDSSLVYRRVLYHSTARSRFETMAETTLTPLVGRQQELQFILSRWQTALEGQGNVALLAGEAGVGKSRLVYELKRIVAQNSSAALIECFCGPQYSSTALFPIIECFERLVFESDVRLMKPERKLRVLEGFLAQLGFTLPETVPLFSQLLGVPAPNYPRLELTPERQRTLTLEALLNIVVERASRQPLLFIVEDLHWADPSTLELLSLVVDQAPSVPLLALYTHRPECELNWPQRSYVSSIALDRLSRSDSLAVAAAATHGRKLSPGVLDEIVGNSDGVPLFLEEMAKTVADSGPASSSGGKLSVPVSLRDSFIGRLDQLGPARNVARMASVLGREFPRSLLEVVSGISPGDLRESLERLVEAEILQVRGVGDRRVYIFKHVLLQEAAYESLVPETRVALHASIASILIEHFPDLAARAPEVVARHLTEAGEAERAVSYWHRAGMAALERSAYPEALSFFRQGLKVLNTLPTAQRHPAQELLLVVSQGPALLATLGFGASEVGASYGRAEQLLGEAGHTSLTLPTLWGVWVYSLVRSELDRALGMAQQMIATAEQVGDERMLVEGLWTAGNTSYWRGDLAAARQQLERAEALYDADRFREHAFRFGQDPLVATLCYLSFVYCFSGLFSEAVRAGDRSVELARRLKHPFSIGWALNFRAMLAYFLGDYPRAQEWAQMGGDYCKKQAYPFWISTALSVSGRSLAEAGQSSAGIPLIEEAVALTQAIGSRVVEPLYRGLLAEARFLAGDVQAGLAEVEEALRLSEERGVGISRFDLTRLRAQGWALSGRDGEAADLLRKVIVDSHGAGCRLVELRASTDLALLLRDRRPLAEICGSFPLSDAEPPVLLRARAALASGNN